jgi:hypothetical protein
MAHVSDIVADYRRRELLSRLSRMVAERKSSPAIRSFICHRAPQLKGPRKTRFLEATGGE